jgi:hypothetical protein
MILSNDGTKVFFEVTKTGTNTIRSLLLPNHGIDLIGVGRHGNRNLFPDVYRSQINPNATQEELDAITGYAFWRDPIDRFSSQATYSLQFPQALVRLFPEIFGAGAQYDLTQMTELPPRLTETMFSKLPKPMRTKIETFMSSRMFYERVWQDTTMNLVLYPQNYWFADTNIVVLNYHDFDNEARRLLTAFGADGANTTIPILNESATFLPTVTVPPELVPEISCLYADDWRYDPRNPQ